MNRIDQMKRRLLARSNMKFVKPVLHAKRNYKETKEEKKRRNKKVAVLLDNIREIMANESYSHINN